MKNRILNIEPSPVDTRDYVAETIYKTAEGLPELFDLRQELPPVRDQGSQGTCSAQVAACMKEWQERKDVGFREHMSPQFVYNNRKNQSTSGMFPRDTMKILHKQGSVPEEMYPYGTFKTFSPELDREALRYRIEGYASINTIDGLKRALIKNGPCYISVPVYNFRARMWKPEQGQKSLGGHAMTVVGYNREGFLIRNSWGEDWGASGYTVFPYEDWGLQWEVWTTIDADSDKPLPIIKKPGFFAKIWNWIKGIFS